MLKFSPRGGVLAVMVLALTLGGCGGGGGGGGAGNTPEVFEVVASISGQAVQLWAATGAPPQPPSNVSLNTTFEFRFGGAVDVTSLPGWAGWVPGAPEPGPTLAVGAVNISTTDGTTTVPAVGAFSVVDDARLPAGNGRIVRFTPTPPSDPLNPAGTAGLAGNTLYTIFVPRGGQGGQTVRVGGSPLNNGFTAQFQTCDPAGPSGASACFSDPVFGVPFVVSTNPPTTDPFGMRLDPGTIQDNKVQIFVSEPLFPQGIDRSNVRLVNANSGAQVPGDVNFFQAGSPQAGPSFALIEYEASSQLLANVEYEIFIDNAIRDFGGNPVELYDPNDPTAPISGRRLFATDTVPFTRMGTFSENFSSTTNQDTVSGIGIWDTTQQRFRGTYPLDVIGDGTFGPLTIPPGPSTLDTGMASSTGFSEGTWSTTTFTVQAGANVRAVGNMYPVHIQALQTATVSGSINGSAGNDNRTSVPIGSPEQGARIGQLDNGRGLQPAVVAGGVGGVGGGKGGDASQEGFTVRTEIAETGFGPAFTSMGTRVLDPGPGGGGPSNAMTYGGGQGGDGDAFVPPPGTSTQGGVGGAGGSAFESGTDGQPRTAITLGCMPFPPVAQPVSNASGIPPVFVAPISVQSAGSGGGGGGDRHDNSTSPDDQGGGGGGGGGGFRISCIGDLNINAGSAITMDGGRGEEGSLLFSGGGGGGSGGQIWLQTFGALNISTAAIMSVEAGISRETCSDFAGGDGGIGLIQLEDSNSANINTLFVGAGTGSNVVVRDFDFSATIIGSAVTLWFDTGYGDPDYTSVVENTTAGMMANGMPLAITGRPTALVEYQGAFEALSGGVPDVATASAFVAAGPGGNIDALDGRRFIRVRVSIAFDPPSVGPGGALQGNTPDITLPTIEDFSINFATPPL